VAAASEPQVRKIGLADLGDALRMGIDDFNDMPTHAAFLCVIYPVLGFVLLRLAFGYDLLPLVYPLLTGFSLLGPVAAIAIYDISKRREEGLDPSVWNLRELARLHSIGPIAQLVLLMLAIYFLWLGVALAIYAHIMGAWEPMSFRDFMQTILSTPKGHQLILVGNVVGIVFAVLSMMISVVSFPMLVDRDVSVGTAVRTSVRAALANPSMMMAWGIMVALALIAGALPLLIGLAVVVPVLGHATWHLYRKVVV
jgi:uncharacterized membrane protein